MRDRNGRRNSRVSVNVFQIFTRTPRTQPPSPTPQRRPGARRGPNTNASRSQRADAFAEFVFPLLELHFAPAAATFLSLETRN
ncbi:hypothetical protein EVAR_11220_1 [Eumeta japonica]|uniref:Uncharacterized protein n=1 Tax=Eumeta variegata TaxID=151549 RepID=A0A4C2A1V8_EUMVA|nr:hypothetical protein EVAR_11220_1 [Eumeta japonica]